MQTRHSTFPFLIVDNNYACDVCHFSKHKILSYHSCFNKSKEPFEIIHFDVWGPITIKSKHNHIISKLLWMILVDIHGSYS